MDHDQIEATVPGHELDLELGDLANVSFAIGPALRNCTSLSSRSS
jgi:hypothetical protein